MRPHGVVNVPPQSKSLASPLHVSTVGLCAVGTCKHPIVRTGQAPDLVLGKAKSYR